MNLRPISGAEVRWHWLALSLLMLLWATAFVFSTILTDPARDLSAALRWVQDGQWPLHGPLIGEQFYLGPLWFWILGGLLWLLNHWVAVAFAVGLLSALKFPLAWWVAREWGDARLGLVWAVMLALPGWASIAKFGVGHTVMVETSLLLLAGLSLRYWRLGRGWLLVASGAALILAVHAHPSLVLASLMPMAAWLLRGLRHGEWRLGFALGGLVLLMLPLLPLWWVETPLPGAVSSGLNAPSLTGALQLLWGFVSGGAMAVGQFILQPLPGAERWVWFAAIILAGALLGWIKGGRSQLTLLLVLFLTLLVAALWLTVLRDRTPAYMSYALNPLWTLILALGWRQWLRGGVAMVSAALVGCVIAGLGVTAVSLQARDGLVQVPGTSLADIRTLPDGAGEVASVLPITAAEANARRWCGSAAALTVLHGDLAALTDMNLALATQRRCHGRDRLRISGIDGGMPGAVHEFGLPQRFFAEQGLQADFALGNLGGVEQFTVHHPDRGAGIEDGSRYPPHAGQGAPDDLLTWQLNSERGSYLAVVSVLPWTAPIGEVRVEVNGRSVQPSFVSRYSRIYRCRRCLYEGADWEVNLQASDPQRVELITFRPRRAARE